MAGGVRGISTDDTVDIGCDRVLLLLISSLDVLLLVLLLMALVLLFRVFVSISSNTSDETCC